MRSGMKQEATKINNQSTLFDLDDYSSDRSPGDYDWENSELDRMYEQPPPKVKPPPPDTNAILAICQWMRGQPNGNIIDLPDVREQIENLLPNLQPPILREQFKNLLPNPENRGQQNRGQQNRGQQNRGQQNRGQQNRGHPDYLPPILEPPKSLPPILDLEDRENSDSLRTGFPSMEVRQDRGQQETDPDQSQLLVTVGDRKIINGVAYILTHTKSPKPISQTNGWLEVKESVNKRNLYLCLRWRAEGKKRSRHLGKVIRAEAA
jgi:hypothetical protein